MKECTLILPQECDDANTDMIDVHADLIEELIKLVGNCRATQTIQFYCNPKTSDFYDVEAVEYKFALPNDFSRDADDALMELVKKYGKLCQTKYVYIVSSLGVAQFIDIK